MTPYLITTSSKSVLVDHALTSRSLYLSYACIPYDIERKLAHYKVAIPYGLDGTQADKDFELAQKTYASLLKDISTLLNEYHDELHGERFWEIIMGHWLWRYVKVVINRYRAIEQVCRLNNNYETASYQDSNFSLAVQDSLSAILAFRDERWNHELYEKIIKGYFSEKFTFVNVKKNNDCAFFQLQKLPEKKVSYRQRFFKSLFSFYNTIAQRLSASDKYFFISTYLPKANEFIFQMKFAQLPKLWRANFNLPIRAIDKKLRAEFSTRLSRTNQEKIIDCIRELAFQSIPICYLEGYKDLRNITNKSHWPKKPKLIFTANNFDMDEYFKLWAADKVESGALYVSAQHGGVYGSYKYVNNPSIEERTSDYFITWGWKADRHIPCCILNGKKLKGIECDPRGVVTLIQAVERERVETHDVTYEYRNYFKDQIAFINSLNSTVKDNLLVRLGPDYRTRLQFEDLRWSDFAPQIKIDKSGSDINKVYRNSRLIIQSYDSTGLLETLTLNIPTIAFWRNPLSHLRPSALPYYKVLLDAGILCDEKSAAELVNRVYDDVSLWWNSEKIQAARVNFCNNFARQVDSRPLALKNALITLA